MSTSPEPTGIPEARRSRAKPTSDPTNAGSSGTEGDPFEVVVDHVEVVALLDDGAERVLARAGGQLEHTEHVARPYPVDGLGDARRLGQVHLAQPVDRGNNQTNKQHNKTRHAD